MAAKGQLGNNLNTTGYREQIKRLYESTNFASLWIKGDEPTSQATYLIEAFRASRLKGLNPSDYGAESLTTQSKSLKGASAAAQASFDASLTLATMRYISDLRIGRINPKHLKFGIDVQSKKYDLPEFITQQVASAGNVQSVLDQIEPPYSGYRRIESALKQYLDLAAKGDGPKVPAGPKPSLQAIRMQEQLSWLSDCGCLETFRRAEASIPIAEPSSRGSNIFRQDMVSPQMAN